MKDLLNKITLSKILNYSFLAVISFLAFYGIVVALVGFIFGGTVEHISLR